MIAEHALDKLVDTLRFSASPTASVLFGMMEQRTRRQSPAHAPDSKGAFQEMVCHTLSMAEPFFCDAEICDLISEVSKTIPVDWAFTPSILPAPAGFLWFQQPIAMPTWITDDGRQIESPISAFAWRYDRRREMCDILVWTPIMDGLPAVTIYTWVTGTTLDHGLALREETNSDSSSPERWSAKLRVVAAMFAFMDQRILVEHEERPRRGARRRAQDALQREPNIRVITLRRTTNDDGDSGSRDVEWSCRWVVRGHWRRQRVGPGLAEQRPTWIMPHVKGPQDKPIKAPTETIWRVAR